jgi:hypothetical protein
MQATRKRSHGESFPTELPGPFLGHGARWGLQRIVERLFRARSAPRLQELETENSELRKRCDGLLSQAINGTCHAGHTDVEFIIDGGKVVVRAHRCLLALMSQEFDAMFSCGMVEERNGVVNVPPGIDEASFKGFIEFLYLGYAGKYCREADGRQLWILSEMYDIQTLQRWLLEKGISNGSVCAACEFGLVPEGLQRTELLKVCQRWVERHGLRTLRSVLITTGCAVVKTLSDAWTGMEQVSENLAWRYTRDAFNLIERWVDLAPSERFQQGVKLVQRLELHRIPDSILYESVVISPLLSTAHRESIIQKKQGQYCIPNPIYLNLFVII